MALMARGDSLIGERLAAELADVEARFVTELESDLPCVRTLVKHVERYRGKRLRPLLLLASGMASSRSGQDVTDDHRILAAVVEMVHMATLVHDDVLDEADVRRRGATVNQLRGNETAVMLGDYLISHAYHLCSSLSDTRASRTIADATNTVCEGELLQLSNRENWSLDEATYFDIIRRKTASLCGTCCWLGGQMSEASEAASDAMYTYGERLGVAFQIVDDLLDITGVEDVVGKSLGRDVDKGKLTLPLIHHLQTAGDADSKRTIALLDGPATDAVKAEISAQLQTTQSVEYASASARRCVDEARAAIGVLADTPARQVLLDMADAVITRKY